MALGPEFYDYTPADLSEAEEFQILMELETDPEDIVNPEERKQYVAYLEAHQDDSADDI